MLLLRDVSELRQRDRLLLSKDATIREIHHRVKNNLQTISSLLRLQARRTASDEAKDALAEAVRRIRTIAIVHETLSREASDDVAFVEIVRPLLRLAEDSLQSPERPVRFRVEGDGGKLPAGMATPLAVVLTELLQNAVAHAFRNRNRPGNVVVLLEHDDHQLTVKVIDDGIGVPDDFSIDRTSSLGLTIVRTLVTTELAGEITIRGRHPGRSPAGLPAAARPGDGHDGAGRRAHAPRGLGIGAAERMCGSAPEVVRGGSRAMPRRRVGRRQRPPRQRPGRRGRRSGAASAVGEVRRGPDAAVEVVLDSRRCSRWPAACTSGRRTSGRCSPRRHPRRTAGPARRC